MTLAEVKECIERVEDRLSDRPFVIAWTEARNGRLLHVALTERLRKKSRKGHVWKSPHMLSTLRNAEYGYGPVREVGHTDVMIDGPGVAQGRPHWCWDRGDGHCHHDQRRGDPRFDLSRCQQEGERPASQDERSEVGAVQVAD